MSYGEQAEVVKEAIDQLQRREFKALVKEAIKECLMSKLLKLVSGQLDFLQCYSLGHLPILS